MSRTATAAVAAILLSDPALGDAQQDQIRAKLLAKPAWTLEMVRPGRACTYRPSVVRGKGRQVDRHIEFGFKCDSEVTLRADEGRTDQLVFFTFDLLFLNGESTAHLPALDRHDAGATMSSSGPVLTVGRIGQHCMRIARTFWQVAWQRYASAVRPLSKIDA